MESKSGTHFGIKSQMETIGKEIDGLRMNSDVLPFPFPCQTCGKSYKLKSSLNRHQRIHGCAAAATCSSTNDSSSSTSSPLKHNQFTDHVAHPKIFTCSYCAKQFAYSEQLAQHVRTHTGERPFACSEPNCDFKAKSTASIGEHVAQVHENKRKHGCQQCEWRFNRASDLRRHMKGTHTDPSQRPHACTYCERRFSTASDLCGHVRIHTGEKPYTCSICQFSCRTGSRLMIHSKVHIEEKPYSCDLCPTRFKGSEGKRLHVLALHGNDEQKFWCPFCKKKFVVARHLKYHVKKAHAGQSGIEIRLQCASGGHEASNARNVI